MIKDETIWKRIFINNFGGLMQCDKSWKMNVFSIHKHLSMISNYDDQILWLLSNKHNKYLKLLINANNVPISNIHAMVDLCFKIDNMKGLDLMLKLLSETEKTDNHYNQLIKNFIINSRYIIFVYYIDLYLSYRHENY